MEEKLRDYFEEMVVYKDLKNNNFFSSLGLPAFLRDYLLKTFSDDYGRFNMDEVSEFIKKFMKTDVQENGDHYEIDIDLPGFKKEELSVELKEGYLVISAVKGLDKDEKEEKTGRYVRRERYVGSMSRSFYVGEDVKQEDIHAKYESGVLKLSIPKMEEKKPEIEEKKYIAIEG